jgi:hypothetical protein
VSFHFPDDVELIRWLSSIADAYAAIAEGDFDRPRAALATPSSAESEVLAAERNYLAALCAMGRMTSAGFAEARSILSEGAAALEKETDLHVRFLLLLQQAQVLSESFDQARSTERKLERDLLRRRRFDPEAAVTLQIQNRRAAAVNEPFIANHRISKAVAFFRRGSGDPMRDRLELYRSLTNQAAIQIAGGRAIGTRLARPSSASRRFGKQPDSRGPPRGGD